jgi:hypothetical protein
MTVAPACGCRHGHAHSNSRVAAEPAPQPPKQPAGSPASSSGSDVCRNLRSCRPAAQHAPLLLALLAAVPVAFAGIWRAPRQAAQRQAERLGGPRGDGGSAARAAFAWERSPRTRKAHQANTGAGQERTGWEISRREFGTRARHAQDPGWFDNRSATLTLNNRTVQAFRVPRPGSGMRQTRARALLTRLAVSPGRCRGFREIRPAAGAIAAWRWRLRPRRRPRLGGWAMLRCSQLSVLAAPDLERYEDLRDAPEQGEEPDP